MIQKLPILLTICIVGIFISVIFVLENNPKEISTPPSDKLSSSQLKAVLGNCGCQENLKNNPSSDESGVKKYCPNPLFKWSNSTHYIDNIICEYIEYTDVNPFKKYITENEHDRRTGKYTFSGLIAEKACSVIEVPCPENPQFKGSYNFEKGTGGFNFYNQGDKYHFKIAGNEITYAKNNKPYKDLYELPIDYPISLPLELIDTREKSWDEIGPHPSTLGYDIPAMCTDEMLKHLVQYSSMFEKDSEHYLINHIGLSEKINKDEFDICVDYLKESIYDIPILPTYEISFDKPSYFIGDSVKISGQLKHYDSDIFTIKIYNPNFWKIEEQNVQLIDKYGYFEYDFKIQDSWDSGEYMITIEKAARVQQNTFLVFHTPESFKNANLNNEFLK